MPREQRKRGKKKPKHDKVEVELKDEPVAIAQHDGPSWVRTVPDAEMNPEAPFGFVDPDVKAYFRTVDVKLREWQEEPRPHAAELEEGADPNEDRRIFLVAALSEMVEKELQLSTDPDCSPIIERMAYSMDDFVRRVFMDKLAGSYGQLITHRFASHVCQTMLSLSRDTVAREARGIVTPSPSGSDDGTLRTLKQLVLDACDEILPSLSSLLMDPFASHVIRALLILLSFRPPEERPSSSLRSKKSTAFKSRQGPMKSIITTSESAVQPSEKAAPPEEFLAMGRKFVLKIRSDLGENEVRALAGNKVASPVLQLLLELEVEYGMSDEPNSLMDRVLVGMITHAHSDSKGQASYSDYLETLLRDPTSSHLIETLVVFSPARTFSDLWALYFKNRLEKLALHPVANFVVAKAIGRLDAEKLESLLSELEESWGKCIKSSRTGVLMAVIDRAAALQSQQDAVVEAVCTALELSDNEERKLLVPCAMTLLTLPVYKKVLSDAKSTETNKPEEDSSPKHKRKPENDQLEPKVQGALILQSMLRLEQVHNKIVVDSLQLLPADDLIAIAHHPTGSRVLDVLLESPFVPPKAKRSFITSLVGHFHILVDDRIGSRVGDRCWDSADPYLREKIARSLIPQERFLASSYYGKFFARNLHLGLLQRKPDEWKDLQVRQKQASASAASAPSTEAKLASGAAPQSVDQYAMGEQSHQPSPARKRKRESKEEHEFDQLFSGRVKSGRLAPEGDREKDSRTMDKRKIVVDDGLQTILGAIKAVPKAVALRGS